MRSRLGQRSSDGERATEAELYSAALRLLGRREYSRWELHRKLSGRADDATLDAALGRLVADGYQSDERFVESFVRSRQLRGQGPARIEAELRQRGCAKALIDHAVAEISEQGLELARAAFEKRFPSYRREDYARAGRFLAGRGFSADVIHRVLRTPGQDSARGE
ncbi:MAG: regulatory protein RecX [Pseudomonadota bacterium]